MVSPPIVVARGNTTELPAVNPCADRVTVTLEEPEVVVKAGTEPPPETPATPDVAAVIV